MRFHPTRGSMSLSEKDGGLPPDSVVQDDDEILADSERLVACHHDPSWGAMVRIALAPCSPFSVTPELMRHTAELAERLDVRLHTHLAEDPDEDRVRHGDVRQADHRALRGGGLGADRTWVAHCIYPDPAEVARLGRGRGRSGPLPVFEHADRRRGHGAGGRAAGGRCRRSAWAATGRRRPTTASLWLEARGALLLGRQRKGPTGMTGPGRCSRSPPGGRPACLGRSGELGDAAVGAAGDLVCWPLDRGRLRRGADRSDRSLAALRAGGRPAHRRRGRPVVRDGFLVHQGSEDIIRRHRVAAARIQGIDSVR